MKQLNLPQYSFKISVKEGSEMILDPVRRKYVKLTPEEWVRQNFVQYLVNEGKYPVGLLGIEVMFRLNKLKRRVDILVHSRTGEPVMIVECKSPDIKIDDKVFDQIVCYNMGFKVPYIVVTNGIDHYACIIDHEQKKYEFLLVIPLYEDLLSL
ncbi:MAG: type I restriction enzyme HsdR N-terminal domain-containing protein [Bacteroidia bacterium]|nr:type I restriction enzyme HsdR N-terminal domain-containing protein [Bacteroidia bacterium]